MPSVEQRVAGTTSVVESTEWRCCMVPNRTAW